jgi:transcription antitermination factor NusG
MTKNWYVLYVKPNNEKKVAENLAKNQIEVYCPMFKELRQWSDRKKKVESPFFKSYVFVRLLDAERNLVFAVPNIVKYLFWLGKPAVIREEEMDTLKKWLSNDRVEEYKISKFEPGKRLSVSMGSLKNQKAIVQEVSNTRVRLIIEGLGIVLNMKIKDLV